MGFNSGFKGLNSIRLMLINYYQTSNCNICDHIKRNDVKMKWIANRRCGLHSFGSELGQVAGFCEHGNKLSFVIR